MMRWSWPSRLSLRKSTRDSGSRKLRRQPRKLDLEALELRLAPAALQAVSLADPSLIADGAGASYPPVAVSNDGRYVAFESSSSNVVPGDNNNANDVFVRDIQSGTTALVSVTSVGTSGNGSSGDSVMTPDGRFVAFDSTATNLTADATNGFNNVFVRDLQTGTTTLVSTNSSGTGGGDSDSNFPQITPDGRYILFQSASSDLVPGETINGANLYVRDLVANTTALVTVNTTGTGGSDAAPTAETITPDGRYVAFATSATNLVTGFGDGINDNIFVRDLVAGQTIPVSVASSGGGGNSFSSAPSISNDGRYVTFESSASNLVSGDSNNTDDIFERDLVAGTTSLVSVNLSGVSGNGFSGQPSMSSDGRYVAFQSDASDLVSGDNNNSTDIFVRDMAAGNTVLVSANSSGTGSANSFSDSPVISQDGSSVLFASSATDLVSGVTQSRGDVFLRNLTSGTTSLISINQSGTGGGNDGSGSQVFSANGSFVAFGSFATNLADGVMSGLGDAFLRNLSAGTTTLVSFRDPSLPSVTGNGLSEIQNPLNRRNDVSSNGRYVVFDSYASNLVPGDNNATSDVFVRDRWNGTTTLVSVNQSGTGSGNGASVEPSISADGRYVAFTSDASDLVSGDNNGESDVFVRDLVGGTTTLVSVNSSGTGSANGRSYDPVIAANGRYVAFVSLASDLAANDGNGASDVFERDLVAGTTALVSVNPSGMSGNGQSDSPALTPDGRYVAFVSYASDLVARDTNNQHDVFLRDMAAGTTQLINVSSAGVPGDDASSQPVLTPDGRYVAFTSSATNLVPGDTNGAPDVFVRDVQAGTTTLVSVNVGNGGSGNGNSQDPVISADGRYVAFDSSASDLVGNDTNNRADVFVRDLLQGTTTLVSINDNGTGSANADSLFPAISADGRYVSFTSDASDLVQATTSLSNLYERDLSAGTTTLLSPNDNSNARELGVMTPDGQHVVFTSEGDALVSGDFNQSTDVFIWSNGLPPVANPGGPYAVNEGDSVGLDGTGSSNPDGSIALYEWDFNYDGTTFHTDATGATPTFSAAGLAGPSTQTIALRVTEEGVQSAIATTTVTISDVTPSVTAPVNQNTSVYGATSFDLGSFIDPGADGPWTVNVNWDDTLTTSFSVTGTGALGTQNHTYTTHGSYTVTVSVADRDGASGQQTFSVSVTPAPLTVNVDSTSKTYGSDDSGSLTGTIIGILNGDPITASFSSAGSVATASVAGSPYEIDASLTDGGTGALANYSITINPGQLTVTPAALTITAATDTKTYDASTSSLATPTVNGLQGTDSVSGLVEAFADANVGTGKTLSVTGFTINDGDGGKNYAVALFSDSTGVINPARLTITASTNTKSYDATTIASAIPIVSGLQGTDTVSDLAEAYADADVGTGKTLNVTGFTVNDGNGSKNYTVTLASDTTGVINPAPLTITAASNSRTYDASTSATATPTVAGLQGTDAVTGLVEAYADANAGTNKTLSVIGYLIRDGNQGNNYLVTLVSDTAGVILPAPLTIAGSSDTKVYDGTTNTVPTQTPVVEGTLYGTDTVTDLSEAFASKNVGSNVKINITGYVINDGNGGNNYSVTLEVGVGTITPAALTITAATDSKTYDATTRAAATPTVDGLQGTDSVTGLVEAFADPNAGTGKTLNVTGFTINDGNGGNNYTVALVSDTTGVIDPARLTITAATDTKTYDGRTNSSATPTVDGLQGSDSVTGLSQAFADADAGTGKTLIVTGLTINDGNGGNNYSVSLVSNTAGVITPAPLTITADGQSMLYGGTFPILTATVTGLVGGDTPDTFNSAPNRPPVFSTVPANSHAGTYTLTVSGAFDPNYSITYENGTLTIAAAVLTITADSKSMVYGGVLPALTASYFGLVNGDTATTFRTAPNTAPILATVSANSPAGSYEVTVSGAADSDYSITFVNGTLTIAPAPLTITADNQSITRGASLPALSASFQGLVNGDTPASLTTPATLIATATSASPVGSYPITVSGATDANYTITFVPGTLTILPSLAGSTSTTVSSSPSNPDFGQPVILTAVVTVTAPGGGNPTGTVQFQVNGTNFGNPLTVGTRRGVTLAALSTAALPVGKLTITAQYSGDANFAASLGTASVLSGTDNERWLGQVYVDLLNRPVDPVGMGTWTAALARGATRTQVAQAIETSPEYVTDVVEGYYRTYLHREAELAGLNGWVGLLEAGGSKEQVQAGIIGSAEYFQNRGGGTVNGFLNALYQDGLGRTIDPSGQSTFNTALANGITPEAAAAAIFSSDEYRQDLVQADYGQFLHRPADDFGITLFLNALRAGVTDQQVLAAILGSGEYFSNV